MAEEPSYPTNVVVFKSDSPRTIKPKFTQSGVTLQYSIDNGTTWNNISSGVTTASSDEIWFRGCATGTKSLYASDSSSNAWVFSGTSSNKLHVYGDLRYLLCDNLGDNIITFNIASYCFSYMFYGCTSLTTAPSLPATTLAYFCYSYMFTNCSSLTTAPALPATTMKDYCYSYMFSNCRSLTTAPSLPATTLANRCYFYMFSGCTSLTTAPSLPATTLAIFCYSYMFNGCTSLKVSATKAGIYQYAWRIPTSGTGTEATAWNTDMLKDTGGPFTGDPSIDTTYYLENPPVEDLAPTPSGYTITFNPNGGTTIPDIEDATQLPDPLPTPTKSGYTFLGWYYDSDFTNEAHADDPLTGDVTLYAKWELNTYTITYNSNGGSIIPQTSNVTQLPNPLPTPTKSGYTFVAWYYESNFQTRAKAGDTIESNVTLYAKWHNLRTLFTGIANAIRSKDGTSGNIRDLDFDDRIKQIQGAIELTQAQYDALGTKDANTYYLIVEVE